MLVTDHQGRYQAPALEPGTYEITAELAGFQTTVHDSIRLSLGQTARGQRHDEARRAQERASWSPRRLSLVETTKGGVAALVDRSRFASCR